MNPQVTRQRLRQQLRQQRAQLTASVRQQADQQIRQRLIHHHLFRAANNLGCYLSSAHEVATEAIIRNAWGQQKNVYLPIIQAHHSMSFRTFTPHSQLTTNRFGIAEPAPRSSAKDRHGLQLDLILVPLVGFDRHGHRLGMGGGFYDRHFQYKNAKAPRWCHHKPLLIGLGYDCQETPDIPNHPWDIPVDGIVTETRFLLTADRPRGRP